jgi:tRNA threonylcarbamoyladenosine biosynthesis protein TsaE
MRIATRSAAQTEVHGARFARARPSAAEGLLVVYLSGDLGAGKTTWVRGFLSASGVSGAVRSPTYSLVELYELADAAAVHLDLYRLQHAEELEGLGIRDWAAPGYLWLIEWPERGGEALPRPDLTVTLRAARDVHDITVDAQSAVGAGWLSRVGA